MEDDVVIPDDLVEDGEFFDVSRQGYAGSRPHPWPELGKVVLQGVSDLPCVYRVYGVV